eukprot:TRINITY_DN22382_c0_g1_i5.p1 TRINITY_DN22382_c0_g1~~TRINITY_DN22382_c0_g1_i5.p1  ORF type:complete len:460 (+),score=82.85 TRINITY_DN22382_c0_g1_i5:76-1455(+)
MSLGQMSIAKLSVIYLLLGATVNTELAYDEINEESQEKEEVVERVPIFTTEQHSKLINQGDRIRLPCFVDKLDGFVVLWKRGETIISVENRVISFPDNRAKIEGEKNGNWLIIESAREQDEGTYTCHITAFPPQEISHRVRIRTRPEISSVQDRVVVKEGDTVDLSCYIKAGYPYPEITWTKSNPRDNFGVKSVGSGPDLMLQNVSYDMAGVYRCRADNGYPVYSDDIVNVTVLHKPYIDKGDGFVHAHSKGSIPLSCRISAYPKAKVHWSYVDHKGRGQEISGENWEEKSVYSVSLPASEAKLGDYRCHAVNEFGSQQATIKLSNLAGPIKFQSYQVENSSSVYNLTWSGESSAPVSQFHLIVTRDGSELINTPVIPSHNTESNWTAWYIMTELEPSHQYAAKISASNSHGQGPFFGPWKFGPEKSGNSGVEAVLIPSKYSAVMINLVMILNMLFSRF